MTDKQINKWLRRRFSSSGWLLTGYYMLMNFLCILAMAWEAAHQVFQNGFENLDMEALIQNGWGYIVATFTALVILYGWKGPEYWQREIFAREKKMRPGVFFCALCLCMGSQMVNSLWVMGLEFLYSLSGKSLMPMLESVSGASNTFSMFLYASILAPIGEEILFRGFILRSLRPFGKRFAILGSAFFFGLIHGNLLQTPYAFLMGLVLGYVAAEYSLFWAVILHMFNNFVLADLLTRLTMLLPQMVGDMLTLMLLGGALVASIVLLSVKRQKIAEHFHSEWMDRRVLKCFFTCGGTIVFSVLMLLNILLMLP